MKLEYTAPTATLLRMETMRLMADSGTVNDNAKTAVESIDGTDSGYSIGGTTTDDGEASDVGAKGTGWDDWE